MQKSFRTLLYAVLVGLIAMPFAASAQPAAAVQVVGPLTRDLSTLNTFTARTATTVNSADQNGYNVSRVICAFNQSSYTGAPSTTFSIQNKDAASGSYYTLVTSAAIATSTTTPVFLAAGAGVTTTANVGAGYPIAKAWRVTTTVAGTSTPMVWGTVGCSVQ